MTGCTTICHLLECASPVTAGCKASGTTYPDSFPAARRANAWPETASSDAVQGLGETLSDPNSYGFRKNRSTADAMSQIFLQTCRKVSATWVLDADIEGFFDNINHHWLVDNVFMDKLILSEWLKSGVVDRKR